MNSKTVKGVSKKKLETVIHLTHSQNKELFWTVPNFLVSLKFWRWKNGRPHFGSPETKELLKYYNCVYEIMLRETNIHFLTPCP